MSNENIANVSTRTWIFMGGHGINYFEIPIQANDRETAIAYFENEHQDKEWRMTKEV
jgi:hypothetical protein